MGLRVVVFLSFFLFFFFFTGWVELALEGIKLYLHPSTVHEWIEGLM